jgi:hypothetical protein
VLVGVDGTASLFETKQPFSKLLPGQPDLGYLAPELLTQSGASDQRSDIFSIGVMLWEALDNGRLFPHHRAAAISRLIARKALPPPRVIEEWALPLVDVAQKALAAEPQDRYQSATELWLALREHLPAPDDARDELAQLAQGVLKLALTGDIRQEPPFLSGGAPLMPQGLLPSSSATFRPQVVETDSRYSMPVDHASFPPRSQRKPLLSQAPRQTSLPPLDWSSLMPPVSSRPMSFDYGRESMPPSSRVSLSPGNGRSSLPPASLRPSHAPRVSQRPVELEYRERESVSPRLSAYPSADGFRPGEMAQNGQAHPGLEHEPPPPQELPRHSWVPESEPAAQRSSPWLAVALVIVAFGGVGLGALVFGAGTAMGPKIGAEFHPAPVLTPPAATPENASAHSPKATGATTSDTTAELAADKAAIPSDKIVAPSLAASVTPAAPSRTTTASAPRPAVRRPAKRHKPAAAAPAASTPSEEVKPSESAAPAEPPSDVPESLPFVTEPWSK